VEKLAADPLAALVVIVNVEAFVGLLLVHRLLCFSVGSSSKRAAQQRAAPRARCVFACASARVLLLLLLLLLML
jgi:hypothetical protein